MWVVAVRHQTLQVLRDVAVDVRELVERVRVIDQSILRELLLACFQKRKEKKKWFIRASTGTRVM